MSGRKHPSVRLSQQIFPSANTSSSSPTTPAKKAKRQVAVSTFEKWQRNYDRDHQTLSWLRCDTDKADRNLVALLWCSVSRNDLLNEELLERLGDGIMLLAISTGRRCHTSTLRKRRQAASQLQAMLRLLAH